MTSERKFLLVSSGIIAVLSIAMIFTRIFTSATLYSNDSYTYLAFARSVAEKGWEPSLTVFPVLKTIPPLLPLFLAGAYKFGLNPVSVGLAVSYICIFLTCQGLLFCSFRVYRNQYTALAAAILVCCLPKIYMEGCNIQRDPLFWAESVWLLYLLLGIAKDTAFTGTRANWHYFLLTLGAAVLSTIACLTRKEGLLLFFLTFAALLFLVLKKADLSRSFKFCLLFGFVLLVLLILFLPLFCGIPFIPGNFIPKFLEYNL